jgi:hypothetical protein
VRGLNSRMRDFEPENSEREIYSRRTRLRMHPRMFEEFTFLSRDVGDGPTALLILAGYLKEELPWITELLTESYREIRDGDDETAHRVLHRLERSLTHLTRGPMREMMGVSKEVTYILEELPMLLHMTLHGSLQRDRSMPPDLDDEGES